MRTENFRMHNTFSIQSKPYNKISDGNLQDNKLQYRPNRISRRLSRFGVWSLIVTIVCATLFVSRLFAQQQFSGNAFTSPGLATGAPAGSYSISNVENVNLATGNLSVSIPLLRIGGRGEAGYTMMLPDDSRWGIKHLYYPDGSGNNWTHHYFPVENWNIDTPWSRFSPGAMRILRASDVTATCQQTPAVAVYGRVLSRIVFIGADGTQMEFYDQRTKGKPAYYGNCLDTPDAANRGNVWIANGSGVTFVSDTNYTEFVSPGDDVNRFPSGVMLFPDGMRYRIDDGRVSYISDRNGNKVSLTYTNGVLSSVTDSLGRVVTISNNTISFQGFGGATRTIEIGSDSLGNLLATGQTLKSTLELFPSLAPDVNGNDYRNPSRLAYVKLPDNRQYKFKYNSYGDIARIELPTGGATEYEWGGTVNASSTSSSYVRRWVTERRLYPNGETGTNYQLKTTYAGGGTETTPNGDPARIVVVTALARVANVDSAISVSKHHFLGIAASEDMFSFDDGAFGWEYQTDNYTADGTSLIRKVLKEHEFRITYSFDTPAGTGSTGTRYNRLDIRPIRITTTLADVSPNLVSKQEFAYEPNIEFNRQTDVYEYDFGSTFKRRTHTDYLMTNPNQGNADYLSTSIYLRNLPTEVWVSSDVNGSSKVSLKKIEYDLYSGTGAAVLASRSNVIGYDSANYSSGNEKRGNATKVTTYPDVQNSGSAINTYLQYDVLGNVVKAIDGKGYSSTITYEDNFGSPDGEAQINTAPSQLNGKSTYAFPTSGTNPKNWITGYSQFDYFTGQPVDAEDINGVVGTIFYNDSLDRPTQTISANNISAQRRQTTIAYDDVYEKKITVTADLNAYNDNQLKSVSFYDGVGRTTENRKYESGGGYISTMTEYDALGRVKRVTNPYRPLAGETQYWTGTKYDALGRAYEVTMPDNTTVSTAYSGNAVTATDQAGKTSRSFTNALGQLTRVDEATGINDLGTTGAPNQATYYTYDTLGNMVWVQQGDQNRYFRYDALGRLSRVRQPEQTVNAALNTTGDPYNNQWTAGFTYDNNGNVVTTTDAKNTTITNNTYDALNRQQSRTYSDGVTPTVTFTYDDPAVAYSKGKLTKVANSISIAQTTEFDIFGRPKTYQQITDGQTYQSSYQYNLSGALEKETYPSGRTVKSEFDLNGDLSSISGKKTSTAIEKTYADQFAYTAAGMIEKLHLGNNLWEAAKFNSRLQITELGLGASATNLNKWKVNYEYGEIDDNNNYYAARNNGNIAKQTLSFDGLTVPLVQSYKYDALNRLKEATEKSGATQTWQQTFGYDRYGNRTSFSQTGGSPPIAQPTIDSTTNRFNLGQGYSYDWNGNVVADPTNGGRGFIFDGDNKQTEVRTANNILVGKYFYDGTGKRVKKQTYDQYGQVKETTIFVYSGGRLIAEYSTEPPPQNPTTSYTATDHLGSPRVITDASGTVTSRRDFMPFGEELLPDAVYRKTDNNYGSSDSVRQRFTGYQKDKETNLDFAEARYYNDVIARFTAIDPLLASGKSANPQTFNRYIYVMNNPLIFTDPSGLQAGNHKGSVYYKKVDGRWAFSNKSGKGYDTRYNGGRRRVVGTDGYEYSVTANGWTQGGKVADAQQSSPASSAQTSYINRPLINSVATEAQVKGRIATAAAAGGIAGGVCVAICGPTAVAAAAPIGGALLTGGAIGMALSGGGGSSGSEAGDSGEDDGNEGYNLVLGVEPYLREYEDGVTNITYKSEIGLIWRYHEFMGLANGADKIIFTLRGFDPNRYEQFIRRGGNRKLPFGSDNYTNAEFDEIIHNPSLFNKTDWRDVSDEIRNRYPVLRVSN